jgi:RNA polymerase sigma-70 factor, ECF subfamily
VGSPSSLARIYKDHYRFVWRVVSSLGVPKAAVDDATQEVFIVLHRRRDELDVGPSVRALLFGIARRVAARARTVAKRRGGGDLPVEPDSLASRADLEGRALLEERAAVIDAALCAMDEDKRTMFMMTELEGMSVPEAAAVVGVNVNTAYTRVRSARALVQRAIDRHVAREEGRRVGTHR